MMKKIILSFLLGVLLLGCTTQNHPTSSKNKLSFETNDDDEYDIIVLDPQYETFLLSIARPKNFYSESYYKNKNIFYVTEWNRRHASPFQYDPNFYEVAIDYQPNIDYGLLLEYKLFNFFEFIQWKYKVNLGRY